MGVDRGFYRDRMPELMRYVEEDLTVKWKKELKPHLSRMPFKHG
jgi:hypothetical protein